MPNGTFYKVKEFYYDAQKKKVQKTDGEFFVDFKEWLNGLIPHAVYCDPSAASWKVLLMRNGYRVRNADNDVINGIRHVAMLLNSGKYIMDKSCTNTEHEYASTLL